MRCHHQLALIPLTLSLGANCTSYLQSCPRWHTRAHSVQQQREPVRPQVRHSKMSWLMCSVPVQVNEHVSLQQSTWRGEASGWLSDGHSMDIRTLLSIWPLWLVARYWAVLNKVRAAWYERPRTAAMNGVQPSVSLTSEEQSLFKHSVTCNPVGETGGSETSASCTFYTHFPPSSVGVPISLFYFYCEMLRNIANFFSFAPGSCHFRNIA